MGHSAELCLGLFELLVEEDDVAVLLDQGLLQSAVLLVIKLEGVFELLLDLHRILLLLLNQLLLSLLGSMQSFFQLVHSLPVLIPLSLDLRLILFQQKLKLILKEADLLLLLFFLVVESYDGQLILSDVSLQFLDSFYEFIILLLELV